MSALIDTNIAIHLRDRDRLILKCVASLGAPPFLSIISRIELVAGLVSAAPEINARRKASLDELLARLKVLDFGTAAADAYAAILQSTGYSRPRTLDRMIAATALAHGAALITINGQHFRDIPGLQLIEWPSPSAA